MEQIVSAGIVDSYFSTSKYFFRIVCVRNGIERGERRFQNGTYFWRHASFGEKEALKHNPAYIGFGPVFPTITKAIVRYPRG